MAHDATKLQGMEGFDSLPDGHYFCDGPNPHLHAFVTEHCSPCLDEDDYDVGPFTQSIETKKTTPIYNMHSYHKGKKPHDAIQQYIRHYTDEGDIVLDPFAGSGGTSLAALIESRTAIAIDRSPASGFITRNYCNPISSHKLKRALKQVETSVNGTLEWLYATTCERCKGKAATLKTVYSTVFQCPRCLEMVPLFGCVEAEGQTKAGKPKKIRLCPHCLKTGHQEVIKSQSKKYGAIPVLVMYRCLEGCAPAVAERQFNDENKEKKRAFEKYDLCKINEIEQAEMPCAVPRGYDMSGFNRYQRDALYYYDVVEVADLYTKRNLWAIGALFEAIVSVEDADIADALRFAATGICLGLSRMNRYMTGASFPFYLITGTFYMPQISCEEALWKHFANKVKRLCSGYDVIRDRVGSVDICISTQSATDLSAIPGDTVDYIFTDPPYADNVQYAELNVVWEAWLGLDTTWHEDEIIVNLTRNKTEKDWEMMMERAMSECFRVLKPGRWLSLCYHDTSEGTWGLIQDVMARVGFIVDKSDSALFIGTVQKSYNQINADKSTKRDLVLNYRKPKPGDWVVSHLFIPAEADVQTFQEIGRGVIRDFLTANPGVTQDRVYDQLVSRMVKKGEMEAHDFGALLRSVAEEVKEPIKKSLFENEDADLFDSHIVSRWYLKDTADQIDLAEQEKEDAAAARLEKFMSDVLIEQPELEGVHYSDLFEQIVFISVEDRPRRLFENWLPEYFYKTSEGTWRPPSDEAERQQRMAIRVAGTLRRMKRFANALIAGVPVRVQDRPDGARTLAEWIRQCRRAGLYEQGRALYEKGGLDLDGLDEAEQIAVEDDYRICVKRGSEDKPKKKRKGRKKKS